jgi:FKBP-type peptidyl-prolyl cis-trans isomerase SlyD
MSEQQIQRHKLVQFTYYITDEAGSVLEQIDIPVSYVHGADSGIHEKIEHALIGCQEGDSVSVSLAPEEGFGPHRAELTYTDDIENVPFEFRRLGAEVEMQNDRGQVKTFIVSKIENGKLTVDGNHPLAGKHLVFNINVKTIRDATAEEIEAGRATGETLLH